MNEKDIRFTDKRVDESWKEQTAREKAKAPDPQASAAGPRANTETSKLFLGFLNSLGIQAMFHLGEIPHPETHQKEIRLDGAREIIDLLVEIKKKTQGNLSSEEKQFLDSLLSELQLKFAQHV